MSVTLKGDRFPTSTTSETLRVSIQSVQTERRIERVRSEFPFAVVNTPIKPNSFLASVEDVFEGRTGIC